MKIRLFIAVCCFALIQFQGKAAVMTGNYNGPLNGESGSSTQIQFFYTIITPSPDYILYFPFQGPFYSSTVFSVLVNGTTAPFTFTQNDKGVQGMYVKLQNPSLAVSGAQITVYANLDLFVLPRQYALGPIQTAAADGTIIDYTNGFSGPPIVVFCNRVNFLPTAAITNTNFTANWNPSPGADSYHLDVSTNSSFSTFLPGFNDLNIGNVLTYTMNSLSPNVTYYFRLTALYQGSYNSPYSSISVLTTNSSISTAAITLSNLTATYNGLPHAATATTTPTGLTVGITYNGSSTVPTNAGTYAVVATVSDINYQGSTTGSLVISKVTITPVLGNLTKTYNGSPQMFTATTSPSGLNVVKTYNGFSSIPTTAGTYAVVATISDANYQGSAVGSLVISKATVTPVLSNLTKIYNGSPQMFTATTTPSGLNVVKAYNGFSSIPTNAGTYAVAATVSDPNYQGTATGSMVISKATANPVLSNLTAVYNGSAHAVTAVTTPTGLTVVITYNGSATIPINASSYAVVAIVSDANYQGAATGNLVISKAAANVVLSNLTANYNGSAQAATSTTTPAGLTVITTYDGSSTVPTNVGTYAVVATVNDANHQGSVTGSLVILKGTVNPVLSNLTATYNGSAHAAIATTTPSNLVITITYDGSSTIPVEVGTYAVVATIDDINYQGSVIGTLTITSIATGLTGKVLTDIILYPNPCKEFVTIDAISSTITGIRIVNIEGVTVMQKDNCLQKERIDISDLSKGVYMVVVDAQNGRGSYRLIIY